MKQNCTTGALYLLLAWVFGTFMAVCGKLAYPLTNVWMILLAQSTISFVCTLPWIYSHHKSIRNFKSWKLISIRTIAGFLSFLFLFMGIHRTALVNAVLMNNTAPIFIPIIAFLWLRVRIHPQLWWGIFLGFVGVVFILKPTASILKEIGVLYALISGIGLAVIQISLREMTVKEKPIAVLFYYFLFGSLIGLIPTLCMWVPLTGESALLLLGVGLGMFFFQFFVIKAFSYARPIQIGPINYSGIVYSAITGWFLWKQSFGWIGLLGIVLVVSGGLLTLYIDKKYAS